MTTRFQVLNGEKKNLSCILVQTVNTLNEVIGCCCLNVTGYHSVVYVFALVMLVVGYLEGRLHLIYVIW